MSFKFSAAHSSRVKKSSKPPTFSRSQSTNSAFSSLPRRKPIQRSKSKPEALDDEDEDLFEDKLDDVGLVKSLSEELVLRDVAQAILCIQRRQWSGFSNERSGMNSTRTAEVLNLRASLPPIVTVSHITALLNSPTAVEREIAELVRGGVVRKIVLGGRGGLGEVLVLVKDLENMIEKSLLSPAIKKTFTAILRENPTALKMPRSRFSEDDARLLMQAGFINLSTPTWTSTDVFSRPGDGSQGTMMSINSISRAASGSLGAVGGEGAVHANGGSGGRARSDNTGDYNLAIPGMGSFLKLLTGGRTYLMSLLTKAKFREALESLLRQRWDGGIAANDEASAARRIRGDFTGVLPGRTKKWKQFYGMSFDWILGECVGAGLLEVFETGSVGRGVRALC